MYRLGNNNTGIIRPTNTESNKAINKIEVVDKVENSDKIEVLDKSREEHMKYSSDEDNNHDKDEEKPQVQGS